MARGVAGSRAKSDKTEATISLGSNFVKADNHMSDADMIKLDAEGKSLVFEVGESFPEVSDEALRAMSADNRTRYSHAREIHALWSPEANDSIDGIEVDLQLVSSPTDKLKVTVPKGMKERWVRPENIRDREAKGWKIAGSESKSFIGATGGVHKIGRIGQDELVLMIRDKADFTAAQMKKAAENSKRAGFAAASRVVSGEAAQAGLQDYNESKDGQKRPWKDLAVDAGEE